MKKALSVLETGLIGALVCIIAIAGFSAFNNLKMKLVGMSGVKKSETTGTMAYNKNAPIRETSIDNCVKNSKNLCYVYEDRQKNPYVYVETVGANGQTNYSIRYLNNSTNATTTEDCIGQLAMGAKVCYNKKGNKVECKNGEWTETDDKGDLVEKGSTRTELSEVLQDLGNGYFRVGTKTTVITMDSSGKEISRTFTTVWSRSYVDSEGKSVPARLAIGTTTSKSGIYSYDSRQFSYEQREVIEAL